MYSYFPSIHLFHFFVFFACLIDVSTSEESSSCGCSAARDSNSVTSRNPIEPARGTQQYSDVALLTTDNTENKNMNLILGGVGYIGTDLPIILRDGEGPRRAVNLSSFLLDIDEVTNNGKLISINIIVKLSCL